MTSSKLRDFFSEQENRISHKRNLASFILELDLILLSAFALSVAFPGFISRDGLGLFSTFSLIPVFAIIRNTKWKFVWFYGFVFGFIFYRFFNFWLSSFHPLANLLVQTIKGAEMVFLFLALKAAASFFPRKLSYVAQSLIWVSYAYFSQSWFAGYPYGTLAYSFFRYKILIQIADFSGIWLLTFLIVLPQSFVGDWFCCRLSRTYTDNSPSFANHIKNNKTMLICYAIIVVFQLIYGALSLSFWKKAEADTSFSIATVQHNADSWEGGYATYKKNFDNLKRMSLEAAILKPDMIVWSETAFVPSVRWYTEHPYNGDNKGADFIYLKKIQNLVDEFVDFGKTLGIPLLTGNSSSVLAEGETEPYTETGDWNNRIDYNAVILFDDGILKQTYLKQHLVPFTEHFPYEKQLPTLYKILKDKDYHWWEKGTESVVFTTSNGITFSTPICFEDVFGYLCAQFIKNGAELLVNMSNDSWSGSVAAERQHMAMAVFRSIENRRTMLRGTNSGITCMILPDGTITDEMESFKMGWKIWNVPVYEKASFGFSTYTILSDVPIKVVSVLCVSVLLISFIVHIANKYGVMKKIQNYFFKKKSVKK